LVRALRLLLLAAGTAIATLSAFAQSRPTSPEPSASLGSRKDQLLAVPVTGVIPGAVPPAADVRNPFADDAGAVERGMKHFLAFNCVGCHAPNGAGGMGPSLSNNRWIHGKEPANIYLSIHQGRSNGMPAWGNALSPNVIWELVSYIQSISQDPDTHFGKTISRQPQSPAIEQVPAQELQTAAPWKYTQPISNGRKPPGGKP
jgi:cytochrome c oxidase cbb3-type subunit 3